MRSIPDVRHIGRDMILGARIKELFPTHALGGNNALQGLSQVPPASIKLSRRNGAVKHTPAVFVD